MRLLLSTLMLAGCFLSASAQQTVNWQSHPDYKYLFKLSDEAAKAAVTTNEMIDGAYDQLVDSVPHDQYFGMIGRDYGHYVSVEITGQEVNLRLYHHLPYVIELGQDGHFPMAFIYDTNGKAIDDAVVTWEKEEFEYDTATHNYVLENISAQGYFEVKAKGITMWKEFRINSPKKPMRLKAKRIDNHLTGSSLRLIWEPAYRTAGFVRRGFKTLEKPKKTHAQANGGISPYPTIPSTGYMVLSQPKYRPGDTLRMKAFLLDVKGVPVKDELSLYLTTGWSGQTIEFQTNVKPQRPGSYTFELVLHDSLDLGLDKRFNVALCNKEGHTIKGSNFRLEEYDLTGLNLRLRSVGGWHSSLNSSVEFEIELRDDNDLPVGGGEADIEVYIYEVVKDGEVLIYPLIPIDTTIQIGGDGRAEFTIPSDLIPGARSLNYTLEVKAAAPNGEYETQTARGGFGPRRPEYHMLVDKDSLRFFVTNTDGDVSGNIRLWPEVAGHIGDTVELIIPGKLPFNPMVEAYYVEGPYDTARLEVPFYHRMKVDYSWSPQGLHIQLDNPSKLAMSWQLFQGNRPIKKGYDSMLAAPFDLDPTQNYHFRYHYIWTGDLREHELEIESRAKQLTVEANLPNQIFPGEQAKVEIQVADYKGQPVSGVDLTAFCLTSKFDYDLSHVPEPIANVPRFLKYNRFSSPYKYDWKGPKTDRRAYHWSEQLNLERFDHYRLTHVSDSMLSVSIPAKDSTTQFSAFVYEEGQVQSVWVIAMDYQPIYYTWTRADDDPYSFPIDSGWHVLEMRTPTHEILVDSVYVPHGLKTLFFLDQKGQYSTQLPTARMNRLPDWEAEGYKSHIFSISEFERTTNPFVEQYGRIYSIRPYNSDLGLVGPMVNSGALRYVQPNKFQYALSHTTDVYKFEKHLVTKGGYEPFGLSADRQIQRLQPLDMVKTEKEHLHLANIMSQFKRYEFRAWEEPVFKQFGGPSFQLEGDDVRTARFLLFKSLTTGKEIYARNRFRWSGSYLPEDSYAVFLALANGDALMLDKWEAKEGFKTIWRIDSVKASVDNWQRFIDLIYPVDTTSMPGMKVISGTVSDEYGPLPFAKVFSATCNAQAWTNDKGEYVIRVPQDCMELQVKFRDQSKTLLLNGCEFDVDLDEPAYGFENGSIYNLDTREGEVTYRLEAAKQKRVQKIMGRKHSDMFRRFIAPAEATSEMRILSKAKRLSDINFMSSADGTAQYAMAAGATTAEEALVDEVHLMMENQKQRALTIPTLANSLRTDFRDLAFWEPSLLTNDSGKAQFRVEFPDDITKWDAHIIAMNTDGFVGKMSHHIKSFRPVATALSMPKVVVAGDELNAIATVANYLDTTIAIDTWSVVSGDTTYTRNVLVERVLKTHLPLKWDTAGVQEVSYGMEANVGFADGERREIEVISQGIEKQSGEVFRLETGQVLQDSLQPGEQFYFMAGHGQLLEQMAQSLVEYPYNCTEQVASRLAGYLALQQAGIKVDRRTVKQHIKTLQDRRTRQLWSWWGTGSHNSWVSLHVVRMLEWAKDLGYKVNMPDQNWQYDRLWSFQDMDQLTRQKLDNQELLIAQFADPIRMWHSHELEPTDATDALRAQYVMLKTGKATEIPALAIFEKATALGNIIYADTVNGSRSNVEDIIFPSLAAARCLQALGDTVKLEKLLSGLLESEMYWNTANKAELLRIFADQVGRKSPAAISVGTEYVRWSVLNFPFVDDQLGYKEVKIDQGPVYVSKTKTIRTTTGSADDDFFSIQTSFDDTSGAFKTGEPVVLKVDIDVDVPVSYVLIKLPKPAGCDYFNKGSWKYRSSAEFDKEEVRFYIQHLSAGKNTFSVELMPRYTGTYHVNPALVEMMYMPAVNANTGMKEARID